MLNEVYNYIVNTLETNQFAQGGFMISILLALGNILKSVPIKLWERFKRLIIYNVHIEEVDILFIYFELWLSAHHNKTYRNVEASIHLDKNQDITNRDIISEEVIDIFSEKVHYKQFNDSFYIKRGLFWIRIYKGREKLENANSLKNAFYNKFSISGLFAKKEITKLIQEVHEYAKNVMIDARKKSVVVKTSTDYGYWIDETVVEPKDIDNIILDCKQDIIDDLDNFIKNRKWYEERNIIYKRGYMFSGDAGCGKTSITLSLAKHYNKCINFLQLNGIDDGSIRKLFRELTPNSILVIEDVDSAYNKRNNGKDINFSFSTILNCLDGVFSKENIIVIFTTNHPEKLDKALIRAGRIDKHYKFKRPSYKYVNEYLTKFFGVGEYINEQDNYQANLPMVDIQDICLVNSSDHTKALESILEADRNTKL